jgi:hypothetical protein
MADEPEVKATRVDVLPQFRWIWHAWHSLHDDRAFLVEGVSAALGATIIRSRPGRIPWSRVRLWARFHRMTRSETQLLYAGIRSMDDVFLEDWQRRVGKLGQ